MEYLIKRSGKLALAFFAFVMISCSPKTQQEVSEHLLLEPVKFSERLKEEKKAQLIDVRTPGEFQAGSIDGANNWNFLDGSFEKQLLTLDSTRTVFVFCQAGGRSGKAASMLKEKGFKSVIDLKGGYGAWIKQ